MTEPEFIKQTRVSYDAAASGYARRFLSELAARPLDRALIAGFAELVREAGTAPIADIGCGPGSTTAYLNGLGSHTFGIDLSPKMVEIARHAYPNLRFDIGSMLALDLPDWHLGGIIAWYSIIHMPDEQLPSAFTEFFRVLAPGGYLLIGFQAGSEMRHRTNLAGHPVSLHFYRRQPDQIGHLLTQAGLEVRASVLREPEEHGEFPEEATQAFVLARKPLTSTAKPKPSR